MAPERTRPRVVALVVATTFFMQMLDGSIIATSLPQMARTFGVQPLDLSIGVTIYMLCSAAFLPLSGWLADRFGARRVYLWAIALFALSSVGCGLAEHLWQFVLARAVQGLGGAMMTPVGRIVVLRSTDKAGLLKALATITWPALTAPVIGPVLGGLVTTYFSWRWNFLANLPIGLASLLLVRRFVPDYRGEKEKSFDLAGFLLVSTALISLLHGLDSLAHARSGFSFQAAGFLATGVVLGWAALGHLRTVRNPVLNLAAFRHRTFAMCTINAGLLARVAISSGPFLLPLLFQEGLGYSPVEAGFFMLAYFAGNFAMKSVALTALRRFGFRKVVIANGMAVTLCTLAFAAFSRSLPVPLMAGVLVLAGLTRSMQFTCLGSLVFSDVEDSERSSASTIVSMSMQASMGLGVSVSAVFLALSGAVSGGSGLRLPDFRFAFLCAGALALWSALWFLRLPHSAGADVTGHAATGGADESLKTESGTKVESKRGTIEAAIRA